MHVHAGFSEEPWIRECGKNLDLPSLIVTFSFCVNHFSCFCDQSPKKQLGKEELASALSLGYHPSRGKGMTAGGCMMGTPLWLGPLLPHLGQRGSREETGSGQGFQTSCPTHSWLLGPNLQTLCTVCCSIYL